MHLTDHQRARELVPDAINPGPINKTDLIHGLALGVIDGATGKTGMYLTRHGKDVRDEN